MSLLLANIQSNNSRENTFIKELVNKNLPIWNMLMCWTISVLLGKSEINNVNLNKNEKNLNRKRQYTWSFYIYKTETKSPTWLARLPRPIRKLSGLISRCRKYLECTNSTLLICKWKIKKLNSQLKRKKVKEWSL